MKILFISKYASIAQLNRPRRQYFFARELAKQGHKVKLIFSRSNANPDNPKTKGFFKSFKEENFVSVMLSGPALRMME